MHMLVEKCACQNRTFAVFGITGDVDYIRNAADLTIALVKTAFQSRDTSCRFGITDAVDLVEARYEFYAHDVL